MAFKFSCPACKKVLTLPDTAAGKRGRCPGCRNIFIVPSRSAGSGTPPGAPPTAVKRGRPAPAVRGQVQASSGAPFDFGAAAREPRPHKSSGCGCWLVLGALAAFLVLLAGGAGAAWYFGAAGWFKATREVAVKSHTGETPDTGKPPEKKEEEKKEPEKKEPEKKEPEKKGPEREPEKKGPPAPAALRIMTPREITLEAGRPATMVVRVVRENCKGAVRVTARGSTDKVTAQAAAVPEDDDSVGLEVSAARDAPAGRTTLHVTASLGQLSAEADVPVAVKAAAVVVTPAGPGAPAVIAELRRFEEHKGAVHCVTLSPDGRTAVSGGADKTIRLWDVATGKQQKALAGHTDAVRAVAVSPDGRFILSGGADVTVRLWDAATGKEVRTFKPDLPAPGKPRVRGRADAMGKLNAVAFSADGALAVSCDERSARLWQVETGMERDSLPGQFAAALFVPGGKHVLVGGIGEMTLWGLDPQTPSQRWRGGARAIARTAEGQQLVVCSGGIGLGGSQLEVRDARTGQTLQRFLGDVLGDYQCVALTPDDRLAVAGDSKNHVRLWEVETAKEVNRCEGHTGPVNGVAVTPDGKLALSAGGDGTVRVWPLPASKAVVRKPPQPGGLLHTLMGHKDGGVWAVAFSPDGKWVVTGSQDTTIRLWNADNGKEVREIDQGGAQKYPICHVSFSTDGKTLLAWQQGDLQALGLLWDTATWSRKGMLAGGHRDRVFAAALSADGKMALSAGNEKTIVLWDTTTGRQLKKLPGHPKAVLGLAFPPGGGRALSCGQDGTVRLWDLKAGREAKQMKGHTSNVSCVACSPDGKQALSGGQDKTVRLWDLQTGKEVRAAFEGHTDLVQCVAFAPDGKRAVSGGRDNTARLWDLATGKEAHAFKGHNGWVWSAAFSKDGTRLVTGSQDTTARIWAVPPGAAAQQ